MEIADPPENTPVAPAAVTGEKPLRLALVLGVHVTFNFIHSILFANVLWLMPLLVRLRFGSADTDVRDWQTTLVTAAIPTFLMTSIFWNELLQRVSLRHYLLIFWVAFAVPLGCIGLVNSYWPFFFFHVLAAAGIAGWHPVDGKLLKAFYADAIRGRMFAVLNIARLVASVVAIWAVGMWLEEHPDAFRIFFPGAAMLELGGVLLLFWLVRRTRTPDEPRAGGTRSWRNLLRPVLHMGRVLRADRTFLRYELAFMTYGAAFMFCDALLPVLATERFNMRYEDYAHSTQMVVRVATLALTFPTGWLLDRIGPVRTSGFAFAVLAVYPVLLLSADSVTGITIACAVFGIGLAGVMMGWKLGPVMLARTTARVPQYAAIHATLVGVRGVFFQGLGMGLYKLTGSFTVPLALGAVAFLFGAVQMWTLHGALRRAARQPPTPVPSDEPVATDR